VLIGIQCHLNNSCVLLSKWGSYLELTVTWILSSNFYSPSYKTLGDQGKLPRIGGCGISIWEMPGGSHLAGTWERSRSCLQSR
jgi:hypothetical protein